MAGNHGGASLFARTLIGLGIVGGVIAVALLVGSSGSSPSPRSSSHRAEVEIRQSTPTTTVAPAGSNVPVPAVGPSQESSSPASSPAPAAAAPAPPPPAADQTMLLVCETGIISDGGTETSSIVVTRVPIGTPVPPGCHIG